MEESYGPSLCDSFQRGLEDNRYGEYSFGHCAARVLEAKNIEWVWHTSAIDGTGANKRPTRLLEGNCGLPQERSSDRPALGEELGLAGTPPCPWQTGYCLCL